MTHGEISWPPLLWIGNHAWIRLKSVVAAVTIQKMKLAWVTYLGALSHINAILIPRISAHPPILAQCKVHRPWALFREGTVHVHVHVCTQMVLTSHLTEQDAQQYNKDTLHSLSTVSTIIIIIGASLMTLHMLNYELKLSQARDLKDEVGMAVPKSIWHTHHNYLLVCSYEYYWFFKQRT